MPERDTVSPTMPERDTGSSAPRGGGGVSLLLPLDPGSDTPLYRQVYEGLREGILTGRLRSGTRLPATRTLAEELGLSRSTVIGAYERLRLEGFLEARVGAGTWVAPGIDPDPAAGVASGPAARAVSARGEAIVALDGPTPAFHEEPRPFQLGIPALDLFPVERWARVAGRCWRNAGYPHLTYGGNTGLATLRAAIADHARTSRAVRCEPDQVIVVEGTQQGLDLAARVLLDEGEAVWMEDPGYPGARGTLIAAGATPTPVPVDAEGIVVERGRSSAPDARAAYVTPSHQFPLGVVMSLPRRLALLSWAEERDAWIIEDDYDSEFRYEGQPLSALQGLDRRDRVIYCGSFSKTLFPALRLGYLIVPPDLIDAFARARAYSGQHAPTVSQAAVARFMRDGQFARHVRRCAAAYRERRDALVSSLHARLGGLVEVGPVESGLHVACTFRERVDGHRIARRIEEEARARDLVVYPLSRFRMEPGPPGLVLGYGPVPPERIDAAVARLADAVEHALDAQVSTTV